MGNHDKNLCAGCRNNIYNTPTRACWERKSAKLEERIIVGVNQIPPFSRSKCESMLSCYYPIDKELVTIKCGSKAYLWEE